MAVNRFNSEDHHNLSGKSMPHFVGNFQWKIEKDRVGFGVLVKEDSTIYRILNMTCEPDERIFRYTNEKTQMAGMMPFIKLNIEKGLIYFLRPECMSDAGEGSEKLLFDKKGIKALNINLVV